MSRAHSLFLSIAITLLLALPGCGGGGGGTTAGIGGTGKVAIASGTITAFGSIFVNGVEYEIDSSNCEVDDSNVSGNCQTSLDIGMVVTVTGTVSGSAGTATSVIYDDDVEGPVANLQTEADGLGKTFTVLGTAARIDITGTHFDNDNPGFSFDTIANGDVVELSGLFDASNVLQVTFIEKKSDFDPGNPSNTDVEVKGFVSGAPVGGAGTTGDQFTINGIVLTLLANADLSDMPGAVVSNGDFVEAKGVLTSASTINASKVEPEDQDVGDDGDDISIEGLVSGFTGDLGNFQVAGQTVDASGATFSPATLQAELVNDLKVEVEGTRVGTTLIVDEVEARGNTIKVHATVSAVGSDTVTLQLGNGNLPVTVDNKTQFDDNLGLADISNGDFLRIRGYKGSSGVVASEVRRENPDDIILQGPVDSVDPNNSITILGISFFVNGATQYEDENDMPSNATTFFGIDRVGSTVKIKDNDPDGFADEVDLED